MMYDDDISSIILDSRIRDWVLIPIFFVMIVQAIVRANLSILLNTSSKKNTADDMTNIAKQKILKRTNIFRKNMKYIPPNAIKMRKVYYCENILNKSEEKKIKKMIVHKIQCQQCKIQVKQ